MLTGPLCRAGRALAEVSRERLSAASGVDAGVIQAFERNMTTPDGTTRAQLARALEHYGVLFIPEGSRGAGVRLKFTQSENRRLATLEGEGGPARADDVP